MNIIPWSLQYLDVANDGFKAELLWWKWATKSLVPIPKMNFSTPEGHLYASFFSSDYEMPTDFSGIDIGSPYMRNHVWACFAAHTGADVPLILDGTESNNDAVHKILWASGFGQWAVGHEAPAVVLAGLESADDNEHAMSVLAMRLLGHNVQVRSGITAIELSPQTYHASLVADVCPHLPLTGVWK